MIFEKEFVFYNVVVVNGGFIFDKICEEFDIEKFLAVEGDDVFKFIIEILEGFVDLFWKEFQFLVKEVIGVGLENKVDVIVQFIEEVEWCVVEVEGDIIGDDDGGV